VKNEGDGTRMRSGNESFLSKTALELSLQFIHKKLNQQIRHHSVEHALNAEIEDGQ
jgi:hypothetical protein